MRFTPTHISSTVHEPMLDGLTNQFFSATGKLSGFLVKDLLPALDGADEISGQPFDHPTLMTPNIDSSWYSWSHYGIMIPDLPAPHQFFSIMSIIGTGGALFTDNDHMIKGTPRNTATFVSGTAAMQPHHFKSYSIKDDCEMKADGSRLRFGDDLVIEGSYPKFRVHAAYDDLELEMTIKNTDKVTWFLKNLFYDHISLLSDYEGHIIHKKKRTAIKGICTFEYATATGFYNLTDSILPENAKMPIDFFSYQIINLDDQTQLLLARVCAENHIMISKAFIRSKGEYSQSYDAVFEVQTTEAVVTPAGKPMKLPKAFTWVVKDDDGTLINIDGSVNTQFCYGLGAGYVGGYTYEGRHGDDDIKGTGYIEYVDCRDW